MQGDRVITNHSGLLISLNYRMTEGPSPVTIQEITSLLVIATLQGNYGTGTTQTDNKINLCI